MTVPNSFSCQTHGNHVDVRLTVASNNDVHFKALNCVFNKGTSIKNIYYILDITSFFLYFRMAEENLSKLPLPNSINE